MPTLMLMDGDTGSLGVLRLVMPSGSRVDMSTSTSLPQGDLITTTTTVTITYTYDPLYRLTSAEYSDGTFFRYTHDAVGNRLTWETTGGVITYTYDIANRLTSVDGEDYTWDDNGNLLNDGEYVYTYDQANRLTYIAPVIGVGWADYEYNGLGDRMRETMYDGTTEYALDLASGLTQVLADDDGNRYLYGVGRIGEEGNDGWVYHHGDALGSVRQLTDANGAVTLAKGYQPYGEVLSSNGDETTSYGFASEWTDGYSEMLYLRARWYAQPTGRFITRDTWGGDYYVPMSFNKWLYVLANPVTLVDPSGYGYCDSPYAVPGDCDWYCGLNTSDPPTVLLPGLPYNDLIELPGVGCDADCMDAYQTYFHLVMQLGREPDMGEILYMTAAKEYFAYVDHPYHNNTGYVENPMAANYPQPSARPVGREALARAYHHFCAGENGECRGTELYRFLSGYEPWCGKAGADNGNPQTRAYELIWEGLRNNLGGTGIKLWSDVGEMRTTEVWTRMISDRPWQWKTEVAIYPLEKSTFGFDGNRKAILAVEVGGGQYLWMVTAAQNALWR